MWFEDQCRLTSSRFRGHMVEVDRILHGASPHHTYNHMSHVCHVCVYIIIMYVMCTRIFIILYFF